MGKILLQESPREASVIFFSCVFAHRFRLPINTGWKKAIVAVLHPGKTS